jgi:asparagine synthase (glutamine-hydrolysing)
MCGICGIIGEGDVQGDILQHMLRRLIHRGPDDEGIHRERGMAFGARRLQVIDPEGGHQPVHNETGTIWAVMNGEIYNYRELREHLLLKGHRLSSRCDTEVLVHLYEDEGLAGFHRLRGMFAIALWDGEREEAWLVRDRLGIKPLYYAVRPGAAGAGNRVVFSSELPSLLEALPDWRLRNEAIADYLTYLYVPGPDTIVEGVSQLRPGEALKVSRGRLEFVRYYRPVEQIPAALLPTSREAHAEVLSVLRAAVRAHLVSDVPLGLFLSGGLDSASLLALMQEAGSGPVKTFSIGYEHPSDQSFNELAAARRLADHFGAVHTETLVNPDALSLLPRVVEAMGEPFADSSAIPTFLVSEIARRSVTVALSGIGGDEMFGGYPRYLGIRAAALYQRMPRRLRWLAHLGAHSIPERGSGRDHLARLKRFVMDGHRPLNEQYRRWTTFIPAEWQDRLWSPAYRAVLSASRSYGVRDTLFDRWPSPDPADRAMGVDLQTYLPDDLLRMGDRMSMAHSLELRVPFCDHEVLASALRVGASARFNGWQLKGFMREMLHGVLPEAILRAPKQGFMVPMARWFREDLHDMVRDLLSDEAIRRRDYVKPAYVRWLLQEHQSGRRNCADQLYALMVLELWHQGIAARSPERVAEAALS